ncbi:hypothetical protein P4O66_012085 [Electrophorus voltai]|uniref:Serine/arginine repetitive matrix protein C-terminal domain-containing protein n=1 Tax=Electrophorus voltai TaxID=2609070 RepID=A0AAD9DTR6_9TELE|nr:hypothetical protein P4O66_012085 [Electrophorus voltai]
MASLFEDEKQLFEKFWRGTFKAVAMPRPESVIIASIAASRPVTRTLHAPLAFVHVLLSEFDYPTVSDVSENSLLPLLASLISEDGGHPHSSDSTLILIVVPTAARVLRSAAQLHSCMDITQAAKHQAVVSSEPPNAHYDGSSQGHLTAEVVSCRAEHCLSLTVSRRAEHWLPQVVSYRAEHCLSLTVSRRAEHWLPQAVSCRAEHCLSLTVSHKAEHWLPQAVSCKAERWLSLTVSRRSEHCLSLTVSRRAECCLSLTVSRRAECSLYLTTRAPECSERARLCSDRLETVSLTPKPSEPEKPAVETTETTERKRHVKHRRHKHRRRHHARRMCDRYSVCIPELDGIWKRKKETVGTAPKLIRHDYQWTEHRTVTSPNDNSALISQINNKGAGLSGAALEVGRQCGQNGVPLMQSRQFDLHPYITTNDPHPISSLPSLQPRQILPLPHPHPRCLAVCVSSEADISPWPTAKRKKKKKNSKQKRRRERVSTIISITTKENPADGHGCVLEAAVRVMAELSVCRSECAFTAAALFDPQVSVFQSVTRQEEEEEEEALKETEAAQVVRFQEDTAQDLSTGVSLGIPSSLKPLNDFLLERTDLSICLVRSWSDSHHRHRSRRADNRSPRRRSLSPQNRSEDHHKPDHSSSPLRDQRRFDWGAAVKLTNSTPSRCRALTSERSVKRLHPGLEALNRTAIVQHSLSNQGKGHADYDSGNDTSSPPSTKTGITRAKVVGGRNVSCQELGSPEKLRFTSRDNVSDSGNSLTSYDSACEVVQAERNLPRTNLWSVKREESRSYAAFRTLQLDVASRAARSLTQSESRSRSRTRSSRSSRYRDSDSGSRSLSSSHRSYCRSSSYSRDSRSGSVCSVNRGRSDRHSRYEAVSARKRPIPYYRPSPSSSSSSRCSSLSSWSLFSLNHSRSPRRTRSSYRSYSHASSWNSAYSSRSRSRSRSRSYDSLAIYRRTRH